MFLSRESKIHRWLPISLALCKQRSSDCFRGAICPFNKRIVADLHASSVPVGSKRVVAFGDAAAARRVLDRMTHWGVVPWTAGLTAGSPGEKESIPNLTLRGFGRIDRVKAKLEQACPGVVSCADILALVARDVVVLTKGPHWDVPTGRRDGRRSVEEDALNNLPPPFFDAARNLHQFFIPKGLDAKDQVVLLGGHTLGTSHCSAFSDRLYNFNGTMMPDPSLDKRFLPRLKSKCTNPSDTTTLVEMDPGSFRTFDASYYRHIAKGRSLFTSDQTLLDDPFARDYVQRQAAVADAGAYPAEFFADFAASMAKMGNMQVLTGAQGEIRRHCAFVN